MIAEEFPTIALELKETELTDLIGPADLAVGQVVNIFSRYCVAMISFMRAL